ncbi:GyrI-like domain-containing protein [Leucobacter musarum]|uniref:GyrI-like domain-containing protein n=1 Tax=Leucobacter musarum TaxID=1930747 RepID=UPI0006A7D2C5|nr:GyrI-like domain-containing protein [Leucobacter musarum]
MANTQTPGDPPAIPKRDLKRELDAYRAKPGEFRVLEVPSQRAVMIDGHGDPNVDPAYAAAVAALYPLAYAVKFASKRELGRDYTVMPLEGLWWADDYASFTTARDKSQWRWTLLIVQPDWIDAALVETARARVAAKPDAPARLADVRFETISEGRCVQTLHVGSYDDEAPVLAQMHDVFMPSQGLRPRGTHHEIYLSDPRRTAPCWLRTILRQPVEDAGTATAPDIA